MNIYILKNDNTVLLLLYDNNKCVEIRCFEETGAPSIGMIMTARVKDVVNHISGAFVDIGVERNAYLPFSSIDENTVFTKKISPKFLVSGDELLVQVVKEPMGSKPYNVTSLLSLSGKGAVVFLDGRKSINISKKLKSADFAEPIKNFTEEKEENYSIILRTNAPAMEETKLLLEVKSLWEQMSSIVKKARYITAPSIIYSPIASWMEVIRDIRNEYLDKIITDDPNIYEKLFLEKTALCLQDVELELYKESYSLKDKISLYSVCREVNNKVSWMKSGAYLVIEQTEALVSIDVNSGKAEKKTDNDSFYLDINLEAAALAAKQIRLRNLSGIILIDFINMKKDEDREKIVKLMNQIFSNDSVKTHIEGFTRLGLMEITREKKNKPVSQMPLDRFVPI